jgi:hypothetical protein
MMRLRTVLTMVGVVAIALWTAVAQRRAHGCRSRSPGVALGVGVVAGIVATLGLFDMPASRGQTVADALVKTEPGSALLEVQDVIFTPVWCSSTIIAFQRERRTDGRRWIEYHDVGRSESNIEHLHEEGGLVACTADGRRLMKRSAKGYVLVRSRDGLELTVFRVAHFLSADDRLLHFVFKTDAGAHGQRPQFVLVSSDLPMELGSQAIKQRVLQDVPPQFHWSVAIDSAGTLAAYIVGPSVASDLQPSFPTLRLAVSPTNGSRQNERALPDLIVGAASNLYTHSGWIAQMPP